jgi:hypothetical protein
MPNQKVEVIPYLVGDVLHISVTVDGKEEIEEVKLATLFSHFVTVVDLSLETQVLEADQLLCALNRGVEAIRKIL